MFELNYDFQKHDINIEEELRMLQGNLNRMKITDDLGELTEMYNHAKRRLTLIYNDNVYRLLKHEK